MPIVAMRVPSLSPSPLPSFELEVEFVRAVRKVPNRSHDAVSGVICLDNTGNIVILALLMKERTSGVVSGVMGSMRQVGRVGL